MRTRRGLLFTVIAGFVAMAFVVGSVIADELLGVLSKVDVEGKKITVIEKDTDKEVVRQDYRRYQAGREEEGRGRAFAREGRPGEAGEKFKRARMRARRASSMKVTHEKGVASKIEYQGRQAKKKAE